MLRSIALALLLASPLAAQAIPFPGGKGYVGSALTAGITWEGKPALLLADWNRGPYQSRGYSVAGYDAQLPGYIGYGTPTPVFRLAAAFFQDWRPCAVQPWTHLQSSGPTAEVHLNVDDMWNVRSFGNLAPNGTLLWCPGPGLGQRIAFDRWSYASNNKPYHAGCYCAAFTAINFSNCEMSGAQFMALVLVIEGIAW